MIIQIDVWLLLGAMIGSFLWGVFLHGVYIYIRYPILRIYAHKGKPVTLEDLEKHREYLIKKSGEK